MGAGLPLDLPEMTEGYHKDVALFPILSESRGIGIVLKRWMKRCFARCYRYRASRTRRWTLGRGERGGVNDAKFEFKRVIEETFEVSRT